MDDAEKDYREAVKRLYRAFARYPLAQWDGPDCCTSRADEETLHAKPLRELTGAELHPHEWHYFLCGRQDIDGFKHLLPRSLELLALGESYTGPEVLFDRLRTAGWLDWPAKERDAVTDYLFAVWRAILSDPALGMDAEDWLVGVAQAGLTIDPFLEIWAQDSSPEAARRLEEIIDHNSDRLADRSLFNPWWDDHEEEMLELVDWLHASQCRGPR